ncbi:MAG: hypothetical protein ACR2ME_09925 [Acidimicrobiia bacterium]
MTEQTAPKSLGVGGRRLWRDVHRVLTLRPDETELLRRACAALDRVERLEVELSGLPAMVIGSRGQPVLNPMLGEIRAQEAHLAALLGALDVPESEEAGSVASERAQKAAMTRWKKQGTRS